MELRKTALRVLIVSIVASGTLAIAALVAGEFGPVQAKILLSALATSGASLCGMACGAAWDQQRWRRLAAGGLGLVLATLALTLVAFWVEPEPIQTWMNFVATGWIFSVAAAHACLVGLARTDRLLEWIRAGAIVMAIALAILLTVALWTDIDENNDAYFRTIGVVAVLMLVGSLSLPVMTKLRALPDAPALEPANADDPGTRVMCPGCGHVQTAALGQIRCAGCDAIFRIEFA